MSNPVEYDIIPKTTNPLTPTPTLTPSPSVIQEKTNPTAFATFLRKKRTENCTALTSLMRRTNTLVVNEIRSHQLTMKKLFVEGSKNKVLNNKTRINKLLSQQELQYDDEEQEQQPSQSNRSKTTNTQLNETLSRRDVLKRRILPNVLKRPKSASQIVRKVGNAEFQFVDDLGSIRTNLLETYNANVKANCTLKYDLLTEDYSMQNIDLIVKQIHLRSPPPETNDPPISLPETFHNRSEIALPSLLTVSIDLKNSNISDRWKNNLNGDIVFDDETVTIDDPEKGLTILTSNLFLANVGSAQNSAVLAQRSHESSLCLNSPIHTTEKRKHFVNQRHRNFH